MSQSIHCLSREESVRTLVVSLYVDDLIFTLNSPEMMKVFKDSIIKEFSMTDLGKMSYFFGS